MDGESGESDNLKASDDNIAKLKDEEQGTRKGTEDPNDQAREVEKCDEQKAELIENCSSSPKEQKPEEDVPEGFFDDFLKEDFMAGLDIVDEDNEDPEETNKVDLKAHVSRKEMKKREVKKLTKAKVDHVRKFRESPPGDKPKLPFKSKKAKKLRDRDSELRKLDKELEEIRKAPLKRQEHTGLDADNFDIRRDPEKTRQAIQRDKIKSAKDKEKRLITDIVQTGLVPPGMELEVDIEEVRRIERTEKKEHITDLREKIRPRKSKSPSVDKSKSSQKKRPPPLKSAKPTKRVKSRISPVSSDKAREVKKPVARNRSPTRRSPNLPRSPLLQRSPDSRRSPLKRRSPVSVRHRSPQYTKSSETLPERPSPPRRNVRSPKWSPKRSPARRRSRSLHRSPSFRRRSRSRSFTNRRRSPIYRKSRSRDRFTTYRGRDRSYSPLGKGRRRRTHSRSPKKAKKEGKISFLEELVAKLNETHPTPSTMTHIPPQVNYIVPNMTQPVVTPVQPVIQPPQLPMTFFTPAPVPQPSPIQPTTQKYDPYDESFFIGPGASLPTPSVNNFQREKNLIPTPQANGTPRYQSHLNSGRDVSKLFEDKRIKLSDFLAITAKPQVSNPSSAKLQEKIKVIQRCQDAIKLLNERRFTGPLVLHKTDSYKYSKDMTVSPLLRKPIVQLSFTTPGMRSSNEMDFTKCCETLLSRVGIEKKLAFVKIQGRTNIVPPKEKSLKDASLLTLGSNQYSDPPAPTHKMITKSLSTQTDKELSSCKECLRRKGILYSNCGIQAGNPMLTFSVSTQVNEADFYSMIPKTQSLASLTPAQLLGKQSMIADLTKLSASFPMSRTRQIPSPPPPPIFHFPTQQSLPLQHDSPYPPPLFNQSSIAPLMQNRSSMPPNKSFSDDRRGAFNKRF